MVGLRLAEMHFLQSRERWQARSGGRAEPLVADSKGKSSMAGVSYPSLGKWQSARLFSLSVSPLGISCSISVVKNLLYWSRPRGSVIEMSLRRLGNN